MSKKKDIPKTRAIRALIQHRIDFEAVTYAYEPRGGTRVSARELGVDEHLIVKTLVMETDRGDPFMVLMHGDKEVSTKQMARFLQVKSVAPCDPKTADKHSGYQVGGTSPLGTRKDMPVYIEASILQLDQIHLNGGQRGLLVKINPRDLHKALALTEVQIAV